MKKRAFLFLFAVVLFSTFASAEIIFNQQPNEIYNYGDTIIVPVKVKSLTEVSKNFNMDLICGGKYVNFYKNGVSLGAGEEKNLEASLILTRENVGLVLGDCKIKASFNNDYSLTNIFEISDLITIQSKVGQVEFNPGESMIAEGNALKKNGNTVDGFMRFKLVMENSSETVEQLGTINNGYFSFNLTLPKNMKAGSYVVQLEAYEQDVDGNEINKGSMSYNIAVKQVPTSLEIVMENKEIQPGAKLKIKTILHDQTGEKIPSTAIITIKKSKNEIVEQIDLPTDEFFEREISYNEPPGNWSVYAVSNMLDSEVEFFIKENKEVLVEVANGTIILTNKGNVPYNDTLFVKLGSESVSIETFLEVDEMKKYSLSAPDGNYRVDIISDGKNRFSQEVSLTGKAIDLKELRNSKLSFLNLAIVWIFLGVVVLFVLFLIIRKGYKKGVLGKFKSGGNFKKKVSAYSPEIKPVEKMRGNYMVDTRNRAKLSLNLRGDKQDSAIVCLRIKNFSEIRREGIEDLMKKISSIAENKRAFVYENRESIFFIFSPLKTRTFKNEKAAIDLAREIQEVVLNHNKIFKYKLDYGISAVNGDLISRVNDIGELEFMGMNNIINNSKKIASLGHGEVLLSREMKERAGGLIKPEEKKIEGVSVYAIKEMRDREQHTKFLNDFLRGLKRDEMEKARREGSG